MSKFLTKKYIDNLSYTDFVALINQTNVPPGSFNTLTRWRVNSDLSEKSNVFEIATTTGFSLLNTANVTGCTGTGVDICSASINKAIDNSKKMRLADKVKFFCHDATTFKSNEKFSHIILGASLGFFKDPQLALQNLTTLVEDNAYILASPFYVTKKMPAELVAKAQKILGIIPTTQNYKDIMKLYKEFEFYYEDRLSSFKETPDELKHYCQSTIERALQELGCTDNKVYDLLYKRLYDIRDVCNEIREYQNYSVLVLKYSRQNFSKRYVEFF